MLVTIAGLAVLPYAYAEQAAIDNADNTVIAAEDNNAGDPSTANDSQDLAQSQDQDNPKLR
ncbi:MAG: hypothetical protein HWD59_00500 [Coxiellaceae bacterium]|nr:MAG: hypothetical protein HWD59_00500 [Coxiellaceae bacterium]